MLVSLSVPVYSLVMKLLFNSENQHTLKNRKTLINGQRQMIVYNKENYFKFTEMYIFKKSFNLMPLKLSYGVTFSLNLEYMQEYAF